ncbi:ABC transporter permease [Gordonia jinhuaensis]|uniref:ABC transporter substrate-binding protein n=1 Tax=Gordonia jinhuaensis TaxID=1517702 RepID=A0A916SVB2_9ACTN|nr:ABC transporter permease [Gordonia jinhuaensis]GGB18450.1 ABC transporter substrate-binding protein [Gordonia jinhuaensis]
MYVAFRDLRRARGRFALIALVVVLVAVLVTFLSGLTAGLKHQNVSAVQALPGSSVVFADTGTSPSFDESSLTAAQLDAWRAAEPSTVAVGVSRSRISTSARPDSPLPVALIGTDRDAPAEGHVELSAPVAHDLHANAGSIVELGGQRFTVTRVVGDDWYAHSPVVYLSLGDWQSLSPHSGAATVATFTPSGTDGTSTVARETQTTVTSSADALSALASYKAENSSLTLMTVLLFVISALVIGAFFTVWTVQRVPDIAVLKALGASTGSLVRDALGQAAVVLIVGTGLGTAITALVGGFLGGIPFVLTASTTILPAVAIIALGLVGAALALRFLITTDPLTALGGAR